MDLKHGNHFHKLGQDWRFKIYSNQPALQVHRIILLSDHLKKLKTRKNARKWENTRFWNERLGIGAICLEKY